MRAMRWSRVLPGSSDTVASPNPPGMEADSGQLNAPNDPASKSGRRKSYLVGARFAPTYKSHVEGAIADAGSILGRPITMQDAISSLVEEAFQGDRAVVGRRIADLIARSQERENAKVRATIAEHEVR